MILTNILLGLLLMTLIGAGVMAWVVVRRLIGWFWSVITPEAEGKPSQLGMITEATAVIFGRAITAQIKTTLMGMESGVIRAQKAVEGDIAQDLAGQSPIAGLLASFPHLSKTLKRNPALMGVAEMALSKLISKNNGGSGAPSNGSAVKFHL